MTEAQQHKEIQYLQDEIRQLEYDLDRITDNDKLEIIRDEIQAANDQIFELMNFELLNA